MKELVNQIKEQIDVFMANADLQVEKNNKQPEPVRAKQRWNCPNC